LVDPDRSCVRFEGQELRATWIAGRDIGQVW
jgi:hypothetical protein